VPAGREAGIWAPSGIAVDAAGSLYVTTGNSDSDGTFDYNDSVIRLSPDLVVQDYWAPTDWLTLSRADTDIGSIGPSLLDGGLVFQSGKNGRGYLLRSSALGGVGGEVFSAALCSSVFGGTASAAGTLYVPCNDGITALRFANGSSFSVAWKGPRSASGPPIVAGGAVWVADIGAGTLYALDATSGQTRVRLQLGAMQHFTTPAAYGDEVFVAAGGKLVAVRMN
jgi:DNA-binding beta-propeller fold protein YncE